MEPALKVQALKVHEAADIANVSTKTIRRAVAGGELAAYKVGRSIRIDRADFDSWFRSAPVALPARVCRMPDRPRRLPTTPATLSVARMRNQDEEAA